MKLKIVSDTSFLISLSVINMEKNLLKYFDVTITSQVAKELKRTSRYKDEEGKAARKLLKLTDRGFIKVVKSEIEKIEGMGKGENSVLQLFKKDGFKYLAADDLDAIDKIVKEIGENRILVTYDIIEVLVLRKILSMKKARKLVKRLLKIRHWDLSETLLEAARKRGLA